MGLFPAAGQGQEALRYSGRVEHVDLLQGVVVVSELAERGRLRRRQVHVAPDTPIVATDHLRPWQVHGPHPSRDVPVSLADVLVGDFVVVEVVREGERATVRRITIVESPPRSR